MCSVVGYVGGTLSKNFVLEGLARLEYRGYDSAGFACLNADDGRLLYVKEAGQLSNLIKKIDRAPIDGHIGIGHTRWSTHGAASAQNAHPQFDCNKKISIVHNGIIENHRELREQLTQAGHIFYSQTDTETIAHLFEDALKLHSSLKEAIVDLVNHLEGAFAFIALLQEHPDAMLLVRKRSPLCIGIGQDEMFVASDLMAFAGRTKKVLFLPEKSFALVQKNHIQLYDFAGKALPLTIQDVAADWTTHEKKEHDHFMLKEIYDQKNAIPATITFLQSLGDRLWTHLGMTATQAKELQSLHLLGCGTSLHAARIAEFFFEEICCIPTNAHLASEFRLKHFFPECKSLYIALSQSGETADTLEALRMVNEQNMPTIALTNVPSSTMVREACGFLLTQAGPEVAVASTKSFSTQIAALYWFAHRLALEKGIITPRQMNQAVEDIIMTAQVLETCIENYKFDIVQNCAQKYAAYKKCIFIGRHVTYPFAVEAALKLQEIAYVFAQAYPAGELKHGPLALIDNETPVIIFSHQDPMVYQKLVANAQEIKARNGHVVVFAYDDQDELCSLADHAFIIPKVPALLGPLAVTGLMQFFVYSIAKALNRPIDKPRNLAKSVTVE